MKRSLRLAPPEHLPPVQLRAVQAVLEAWRGRDWLWHGDQEMARLAVEACRTAFENSRQLLDIGPESMCPDMDDGGSAA